MVTKSIIFILVLLMVITAGCGGGGVFVPAKVITTIVKDSGAPVSVVRLTIDTPNGETDVRFTDSDGDVGYSPNGGNGDYTITPTKDGYSFDPPSKTVTWTGLVSIDLPFEAIPDASNTITITVTEGGVPFSGVELTILKPLGGEDVLTTGSDGIGIYTPDDGTGSYTITPSKFGYSFNPPSQSVNWDGAHTNVSFVAVLNLITITIREDGVPLFSDVGIYIIMPDPFGDVHSYTCSDGNCNYWPDGGNGTYTITPIKSGYSFDPKFESVYWDNSQGINVNFEAYSDGTPIETFTYSWITSDLDPHDGEMFRDGMLARGYTELGHSIPASNTAVRGFFENPGVGIHLHTGHGSDNSIAMDVGSDITTSTFSNGGIQAQYIAILTCLTLSGSGWIDKMGPSSMGLMGYTQVTSDYEDETVVQQFLDNMGDDHTMAWTWYQANLGTAEADAWRIFYRENSGVSDYRPSNVPSKALPADDVQVINKTVSVVSNLLDDSLKFGDDFVALESNHYAITGSTKQVAQDFRIQHEFLAKTSITETEAMAIASEYLGESLPKDAVLEYALPITSNGETIAYAIRYNRTLNGLPIQSNSARNHIELMVNDGEVAYSSTLWPEITTTTIDQPSALDNLLSVNEAVELAAADMDTIIKNPVTIVDVKVVYANTETEIIPAYALITETGDEIVIDAATGKVVR